MKRLSRPWIGGVIALVSAISFALNVPFVALVYEHGGNIHAVNLVRPWFFLVCVACWLLVTRTSTAPCGYCARSTGEVQCTAADHWQLVWVDVAETHISYVHCTNATDDVSTAVADHAPYIGRRTHQTRSPTGRRWTITASGLSVTWA